MGEQTEHTATIASCWEAVIGLEIHCELNTISKLFSSARNQFGAEPNVNITEVCTALPGSLPMLNAEAVRKAVQFGCAINATVEEVSTFDRKSYFYPDSPRNFQITQFERPIIRGGTVITEVQGVAHTFFIKEAHLEDDSGMLKHFPTFAGIDCNRAGVPLIEVVSEPCMHSPKEALAYAQAVHALCECLDISDCAMEEGSFRFDVNISVRRRDEPFLRNRIEIKNMNSFSNLELACAYEIARQVAEYEKNPTKPPAQVVPSSTYRWDPERRRTVLMRTKESADDYRYFPEPDLPPLVLSRSSIDEIRASLPELPRAKENRYFSLGLQRDMAFFLSVNKPLAQYFDSALKHTTNAKALANWMLVEFSGRLKESGKTIATSGIEPQNVAQLVHMIDEGAIHGKIAKTIADLMVASPHHTPREILKENPHFKPVEDVHTLSQHIETVLTVERQSVSDYLAGREKAFAFLVGKIMKATQGSASPKIVNELLLRRLEQLRTQR